MEENEEAEEEEEEEEEKTVCCACVRFGVKIIGSYGDGEEKGISGKAGKPSNFDEQKK